MAWGTLHRDLWGHRPPLRFCSRKLRKVCPSALLNSPLSRAAFRCCPYFPFRKTPKYWSNAFPPLPPPWACWDHRAGSSCPRAPWTQSCWALRRQKQYWVPRWRSFPLFTYSIIKCLLKSSLIEVKIALLHTIAYLPRLAVVLVALYHADGTGLVGMAEGVLRVLELPPCSF